MNIFAAIRRKPSAQSTDQNANKLRLSGTTTDNETNISKDYPTDGSDPNGRTGNEWTYPDLPRGHFVVETVNGRRLQEQANSHLSEGQGPGKIPYLFFNRYHAKVRGVNGNQNGLVHNIPGHGYEGRAYIPHTPIPRRGIMARGFRRTVNDAAYVPGIYIADATRR
jgi:hypothetical protein